MAKRLIAQGNITIMDFSDAIISSYPPDNPFENMLWIDTSQNPPVQKIYKYFYDDEGNKIGEGWVALTEISPIPPSMAYGGYLTCKVTTDSEVGCIKISPGYFSNNKVAKKNISNGCTLSTDLISNLNRHRFLVFTNGDISLSYDCKSGINQDFVIAKYENQKWYYLYMGEYIAFAPKPTYCNLGRIDEYSEDSTQIGIESIIMYSNNAETLFDLLTGSGDRQGMFKTEDGKVFINSEYINTRNFKAVDDNGNITFSIDSAGEVTISAKSLSIQAKESTTFIPIKSYIENEKTDLQNQIDGKVETYNQVEDPSTSWTTTIDKAKHKGDFWYNGDKIKIYNGVSWDDVNDVDVAFATELAEKKAQIFTTTPTPPYNIGDLWISNLTGNAVIKTCKVGRGENSAYVASDWIENLKYTDDSVANAQKSRIDNMLLDSTLTPAEKTQMQNILQEIELETYKLKGLCSKYGLDFSHVQNDYQALYDFLTDNCKINDTTSSSTINRNTLNSLFNTYYSDREAIYTQADESVKNELDDKLSSTDSEAVFNTLTNNGTKQGLYMGEDGNFYFNGQYINAKNLNVVNSKGETTLKVDENGNVFILATSLQMSGTTNKTIEDIVADEAATSLKSVIVYYYLSDSETELTGGTWQIKAPAWVNGKYMWQKTVTTLGDGSKSESDPTCITGAVGATGQNGVSVTGISKRYGRSSDANTQPTTWYTSFPTWIETEPYIWTKSIVSYSNGTTTETTPYVDTSWKAVMDETNTKVDNTQQAVFNALTNGGTKQGIFIGEDGKVWINAEYLEADSLKASKIVFDDLTGKTIKGARFFTAPDSTKTDGYAFRIYSTGEVYSANKIQVYGTATDGNYAEMNPDGMEVRSQTSGDVYIRPGTVSASKYVKAPLITTDNNVFYIGIQGRTEANDNTTRMVKLVRDSADTYTYFMPCYNPTSTSGGIRLGAENGLWNIVYAKNGVATSSDRTLKENIKYLDADNPNATRSTNFTEEDLYNFVKDDLMMAEYNFIGEDRKTIGFIAQDLLYNIDGSDNKVGQIIVNKDENNEQAPLTYSEKNYVGVLAGALRQAIKEIESLKQRVEELEKK